MSERNRGRRAFLRKSLLGSAAVMAACGSDEQPTPAPEPADPAPSPEPAAPAAQQLPDGLDPRDFEVHGLEPLTLETRRDRFGTSVVTPASLFFVRNNLPLPPASIVARPDDWEVHLGNDARQNPTHCNCIGNNRFHALGTRLIQERYTGSLLFRGFGICHLNNPLIQQI